MTLYQFNDPLLTLALVIGLSLGNQLLTLISMRLYARLSNPAIEHNGANSVRPFSARSWAYPVISIILVILVWALADYLKTPALFTFAAGYVLLIWGPIYAIQVQNVLLYHAMQDPSVVEGHVKYARWMLLRNSAANQAVWAVMYFLFYLMTANLLFAGGATYTGLIALRTYFAALRLKRRNIQALGL